MENKENDKLDYTPGPWRVWERPDQQPPARYVVATGPDGYIYSICEVYAAPSATLGERADNAPLIAASPQLLDHCRRALAILRSIPLRAAEGLIRDSALDPDSKRGIRLAVAELEAFLAQLASHGLNHLCPPDTPPAPPSPTTGEIEW